jgi:hypothetical protein
VAKQKPFIIDDSTKSDLLYPQGMGRGFDPQQVIPFMFAPPTEIPLIPESEWIPRIRDRKKYKTGLRDLFKAGKIGPVKDQNGQGFCWAYSVTRTVEYVLAIQNQEYVALSAHSVACKVKGFRDEGGWCGLSAQFVRANGVVPESLWPAKSMSRSLDTTANWLEGAKYRITEDFVDLTRAVYDQKLTWHQTVSCLLQNIPCALDFNWWGHSVNGTDVDEEDGEVVLDIDNSWTPTWGVQGTGKIRGNRKYPDGAVATRSVNPA